MKPITITYLSLLVFCCSAVASELNLKEIGDFSESICGTYLSAGSSTEETITQDLKDVPPELIDELKQRLSKYFDNVQVVGTTLSATNNSYTGVKPEDVAKHNSSVRQCREEISVAAIKSIANKSQQ